MSNSGNYRGDNDDVVIKGLDTGGDGQKIGSIPDGTQHRLMTDAKFTGTIPATPTENVFHMTCALEASGNPDMDVDGSETAVVYKITVPANSVWYLAQVHFLIGDNGNANPNSFGSLSGLSNGVLIEFKFNGSTKTYATLKTNKDVESLLGPNIWGIGSSGSWLDIANVFSGSRMFNPPMTLEEGDEIRLIVRDDLTGLDFLRMSAEFWEVE